MSGHPKAVAVVCPGHGGEHGGMRAHVAELRPDLLALAISLLGGDPFMRIAEGTSYVQPAIYCASLALWEATRREIEPIALAGHSLGEFAALAISGAMSAEDGLRMVVLRGRACQRAADTRPGGMLIVKADAARAAQLALEYELEISSNNAPMQIVLSGDEHGIAALQRDARDLGVRTVRLRIAVPFHTDAMRGAAEELGEAPASVEVSPPRYPVLSAMTARPFLDIRAELAAALVRPVQWRATILALRDLGASRFLETGPGSILSGLIGRTLEDESLASSLDDAR